MVQPTPEKKKVYRQRRNMTTMDISVDAKTKLNELKARKGLRSLSDVVEYLVSQHDLGEG